MGSRLIPGDNRKNASDTWASFCGGKTLHLSKTYAGCFQDPRDGSQYYLGFRAYIKTSVKRHLQKKRQENTRSYTYSVIDQVPPRVNERTNEERKLAETREKTEVSLEHCRGCWKLFVRHWPRKVVCTVSAADRTVPYTTQPVKQPCFDRPAQT